MLSTKRQPHPLCSCTKLKRGNFQLRSKDLKDSYTQTSYFLTCWLVKFTSSVLKKRHRFTILLASTHLMELIGLSCQQLMSTRAWAGRSPATWGSLKYHNYNSSRLSGGTRFKQSSWFSPRQKKQSPKTCLTPAWRLQYLLSLTGVRCYTNLIIY